MAISLTASAAEQVTRFIENKPGSVGLRFGVKNSGCSGFAYVIEVTDQKNAEDTIFNSNGVDILVDGEQLAQIDGTEIDYVNEGFSSTFKFINPNVKGECGCGESFAV